MVEEIYKEAFNDELEKIAAESKKSKSKYVELPYSTEIVSRKDYEAGRHLPREPRFGRRIRARVRARRIRDLKIAENTW